MPLIPTPKNCDPSVKKAIQLITKKLGLKSTPTFAGLVLDDLDTDTITIKDSDGNIVFYVDVSELYFVAKTAIPIEAGMVMGPWLFWGTYASP